MGIEWGNSSDGDEKRRREQQRWDELAQWHTLIRVVCMIFTAVVIVVAVVAR